MGLLMVYLTGITLLWFGLAGIALSLLYPPLKYAALGDLVIMACYSVLPMLGTTFICSGEIVLAVLLLAIPVGSITVAILHVNNTRDIETDKRAGIRTFPILAGRSESIKIYIFEIIMPYCWLLIMVLLGCESPWTLLAIISLPLAIKNSKKMHVFVRKTDSEDGIQLPFTYIGSGKMEYIENSKKANGAHLFRTPMNRTAPEDLYFDFKLP